MARLPDTSGLKNEVITQRGTRFDEACALRQTAARIVEIAGGGSRGIAALQAAIGPKTAAVFTTDWVGPTTIPLQDGEEVTVATRLAEILGA